MKLLFFGDIFGRPGREAIKKILSELLDEHQPDFVIANVENIAHGNGITKRTLGELEDLGVFHAYTSGNHVFDAQAVEDIFQEGQIPLVRPVNYPSSYSGKGSLVITSGAQRLLVINALGTIFMKNIVWDEPFASLDRVVERYTLDPEEHEKEFVNGIFIDFHAEATAEKRSLGLHLDGRVSALVGTHTHVPTCDEQILPKGTAYISDVGMVGPMNSSIGLDVRFTIEQFLTGTSKRKEVSDDPTIEIGAVIVETSKNGLAKSIKHIRRFVSLA